MKRTVETPQRYDDDFDYDDDDDHILLGGKVIEPTEATLVGS